MYIFVVGRIDQIMKLDLQLNLTKTITNKYKEVDYFFTFLTDD